MTMTVFDFENREVKIELPDKPIKAISVTVLSGDETGTVIFDDGATVDFDASYWRICDFFDGSYTVIEEQVLIGWHSGPRTDAPLLICGRNVFPDGSCYQSRSAKNKGTSRPAEETLPQER